MSIAATMEACDWLIEAGYVVPVEPHGVVLENHSVVVTEGRIVAVLPTGLARTRFRPAQTVYRPNAALLPGLVNAHTHNPMTLLRGIADDLPLMVWLQDHIWPIESEVVGAEFVEDGVSLSIAEMIRGGTTCANDNYFFPDVQAAVYHRYGFRARVGLPVVDHPSAWARNPEQYFARAEAVFEQWRDDPLVTLTLAPHAPYSVSDAQFERVRDLAEVWNLPVHLHLYETTQEIEDALTQRGQRPLARLDALGLVTERLIAVHMTQVDIREIELCATRRVSVVHCPESNLKLASGFCPVAELQRQGVNVAIGTDGCASNNDLDMWGEMRSAALLAKGVARDPTALDAARALRAATLDGARALHLDDQIGSIEIGKSADLICVDLSQIETQPLHNVLSQLVYAVGRQHVSDVWIAGRRKLAEHEWVDSDVAERLSAARRWRERIALSKRT